jgi:hypothetical protein
MKFREGLPFNALPLIGDLRFPSRSCRGLPWRIDLYLSESGLPETEEKARLLRVKLSQRANALRERGARELGPDTGIAASDTGEHRAVLGGIERSQPAVNVARRRSRRRLRGVFRGCGHEIAIDSDDVDEAVEGRSEVAEALGLCRLDSVVLDLAALNIQQPSQVKNPVVAAGEIRPKTNQRRQPAAPVIGGIEALPSLSTEMERTTCCAVARTSIVLASRNGGGP